MIQLFSRWLPEVYAVHKDIREGAAARIAEQARAAGSPDLTLLDLLLAGPKLKHFPDPAQYVRFRGQVIEALEGGEDSLPNVSVYRVFGHVDISALKAGYLWAKEQDLALLLNPSIKSWELENLSRSCDKPSILLSIKFMWIYRGFSNFRGTLANTKPVCKSLKLLYGTDFGSPQNSTWTQVQLAAEIGHPEIDPFALNTILWLLGQEFSLAGPRS